MAESQSQTSGTEEQYPDNRLTEPSIGMVYDKGKNQASAFSQNPDGSIGTVDPTQENENMFFVMDHRIPENFYKNLKKYHKNPNINIYVFPRRALGRIKEALSRYWKNTSSDDVKLLYNYKMRPGGHFECKLKSYGIPDCDIPWDTLSRFGLSYGALEKTGNLQRMRNYEPTTMLKLAYSDDVIAHMVGDAKLRLRGKGDNVKLTLKFRTNNPAKELHGVKFTEEDLKNLTQTGNLGRLLETPYGPRLVSRDYDTQQYDSIPPEMAFIPSKLYGVELPQEVQDAFKNGEARIVPTQTTSGELRNVMYQYNAVYNKVMEVLTRQQRNELAQKNRSQSDLERILSQPSPQEKDLSQAGTQRNPTEQTVQNQPKAQKPVQAEIPGFGNTTQAQTQARQQSSDTTTAPRPQVSTPAAKQGPRQGKTM